MKHSFDENTFSDLHKDAIGFRPNYGTHEFYADETTDDRKQEIWDYYIKTLEQELEWEKQAEAEAVVKFEEVVKTTIEAGAGNRETAIKWLRDAEDDVYAQCDTGYFNFVYGLPYAYDVDKGEMKVYEDFSINC